MAEARDVPSRILLYDGVCGLCHKSVRWVMRLDHEGRFCFAPLQGETAEQLRAAHPEIPSGLDTVVFIEEGRVHLRSRAFVYASRHFRYPWRMLYWARFVPAWLADVLYRLIARIRYRVWGKLDVCTLPTTDERARILP